MATPTSPQTEIDSGRPGGGRRRWGRWVIGAVAAVLLVVVGGPYIYINFIKEDAPPPLSVNSLSTGTTAAPTATTAAGASTATAPAGAASTGVEGKYAVAAGSEAGYRVGEVLFGQTTTAVGRTKSVTGGMTISGTRVTTADFSVDMTTVKSDSSQRDGQFRGRIMEVSTYPTTSFKLTQPIDLGAVPAEGATVTESATGDLTLHGVTKTVTFPVSAIRTATGVGISGSIPIVFEDYDIDNPSGGPATTEDNGILEFALNLAKS